LQLGFVEVPHATSDPEVEIAPSGTVVQAVSVSKRLLHLLDGNFHLSDDVETTQSSSMSDDAGQAFAHDALFAGFDVEIAVMPRSPLSRALRHVTSNR
jgi:hypothetical protein